MAADVPVLNKDKHIQYWLRCLRTPLPTAYTANDSNRMTLAFFTLSSLDLLGVLFTRTKLEERREYSDWIYHCQHPQGGFRGSPGTDLREARNDRNAVWDPANLAATFFAVSALCVLGDDLERLERDSCLAFIAGIQKQSGGFAELKIGPEQFVGGDDPRFAYMAASLRWMLLGSSPKQKSFLPDIDEEALIKCILRTEVSRDLVASSLTNDNRTETVVLASMT